MHSIRIRKELRDFAKENRNAMEAGQKKKSHELGKYAEKNDRRDQLGASFHLSWVMEQVVSGDYTEILGKKAKGLY